MLSVELDTISCANEYICLPISKFRKKLFAEIINSINGGNVLDLGCGQTGLYWALGYAERVDSISLIDYHEANIRVINRQLNEFSPTVIREKFGDTFDFLKSNAILSKQSSEDNMAEAILEKVTMVDTLDFMNMHFQEQFDFILSIESVECVNNYTELKQVLRNCHQALTPKGRLLGVSPKYDHNTESTRDLIRVKLEGMLNPDEQILSAAFKESGFAISFVTTIQTPEIVNYSQSIIYDVRKP